MMTGNPRGVWCVLRMVRAHLVLMRPNAVQLGHLGLEIMFGVHLARRFKAPLWLIRPDHVVNEVLYEMVADGVRVRIIRGSLAAAVEWLIFGQSRDGMRKDKPLLYGTPFNFIVTARLETVWRPIANRYEGLAIWRVGPALSGQNRRKLVRKVVHSIRKRTLSEGDRLQKASKRQTSALARTWRRGMGRFLVRLATPTTPPVVKTGASGKAPIAKTAPVSGDKGAPVRVNGNGADPTVHPGQPAASAALAEKAVAPVPTAVTQNKHVGKSAKTTKKAKRTKRALPTYFKRLWLDQVPPLRIPAHRLREAQIQGEKMGIRPEARLVALHMRESGFKKGREIHETKPSTKNDSTRNVSFENYHLAIDHLRAEGFTVVRIGDHTMTPIQYPGLIDLATSPERTQLLEIYCIERCEFFVACDSGPLAFGWMCSKPVVAVNATDPVASIPVRDFDIFITKHVRDRASGGILRLLDTLDVDYYVENFRNPERLDYLDSSPEDILGAVRDMIEIVEQGVPPETLEQREFRLKALSFCMKSRFVAKTVRKWGPHEGYLGRGRLAPSFARKYIGSRKQAVEQAVRAADDITLAAGAGSLG